MVIDNREGLISEEEKRELAVKILNRKYGVGGDGLILLESSALASFFMRIYNPDGSEPEMCGNGARCAVRFAVEKGMAESPLEFETRAGILRGEITPEGVKITLPPLQYLQDRVEIELEEEKLELGFLNTGVPHAVLEVEELESYPVEEKGRKIRYHPQFLPGGTNVDFVKYHPPHICRVRVYERGVEGETLSCGTGAVASAILGIRRGRVTSPVEVVFVKSGESLRVYEEEGVITLEGKVWRSFKGKFLGERWREEVRES